MIEHRIALRRAWRLIRLHHDPTRIDLPATLDSAWGRIRLERAFHWPDALGGRVLLRFEHVAGLCDAWIDDEPLVWPPDGEPEVALRDTGAGRRTLTLDVDLGGLDESQCDSWGHVWIVIDA